MSSFSVPLVTDRVSALDQDNDEDEGGGIFRIRADRFPDGSDDQLYGLLTATLPSLTDLANNTDLVIRFEIQAQGAHYGLMAQDDLENFTVDFVEDRNYTFPVQPYSNGQGPIITDDFYVEDALGGSIANSSISMTVVDFCTPSVRNTSS